jgi:hypothetical protein
MSHGHPTSSHLPRAGDYLHLSLCWHANTSSFAVRLTNITYLHHNFASSPFRSPSPHIVYIGAAFSGFLLRLTQQHALGFHQYPSHHQHPLTSHNGSTPGNIMDRTGCTQATGLLELDHGGERQKERGTHSVGAWKSHGASQLCVADHVLTAVREDRASSYVAYRMSVWSTLKHSLLGASLDHSATLHTLMAPSGQVNSSCSMFSPFSFSL